MINNRSSSPAVALAAAICAGLLAFSFLALTRASDRKALEYQLAAAKNPVLVVVATRNISKGTLIRDEDLDYKAVPKAYLAPGAIARKSRIVGREAMSDIFAGEAVLSNRVSGSGRNRASSIIAAGQVALAVGTDEIAGVAGSIRGGDRVDVLITNEATGRTEMFLANARVLGIGGVYPFSPKDKSLSEEDKAGYSTATGTTIILELTPTQAGKLTQASEGGKVRLALRAAGLKRSEHD